MATACQQLAVRTNKTIVTHTPGARCVTVAMAVHLGVTEIASKTGTAETFAFFANAVAAAIFGAERHAAVVAAVTRLALADATLAHAVAAAVVGASSHGTVGTAPSWVAKAYSSIALALGGTCVGALSDAAVKVSVPNVAAALVALAGAVTRTFVSTSKVRSVLNSRSLFFCC